MLYMSATVTIKVHDVFHDECEYEVSRAEEYIEKYITGVDVENVRIASGAENSPIFITFAVNYVSVKQCLSIGREAVQGFSQFAEGIDVERSISDKNVLVIGSE